MACPDGLIMLKYVHLICHFWIHTHKTTRLYVKWSCRYRSGVSEYRMENTAVARVSDDFYPTDAASWSSHLGICAYNSLFMAPLVQVTTPFN